MWQLSESIDGMAQACRALGIPVVGGNVSLYNASGGEDIDPTPVAAVLGLVDRLERPPPGATFTDGASLVVLGVTDPSLGGSRWAVERHAHPNGALPTLDLDAHARLLTLVAEIVGDDAVSGVHDVSGGGLALCLAECAVRSGIGCAVTGVRSYAELFSESPSRVVVCTDRPDGVAARASAAGVPASVIGSAGGERIVVEGLLDLGVDLQDVPVADRAGSAHRSIDRFRGSDQGSIRVRADRRRALVVSRTPGIDFRRPCRSSPTRRGERAHARGRPGCRCRRTRVRGTTRGRLCG
jgi:phosphoribosylformylglycinamidine synthase